METHEILERLTQLHKTVSVYIFGGDQYAYAEEYHWKIELEIKHDGTNIKCEGRGLTFDAAIQTAWSKFDCALTLGAAPHALIPPVEHAQIEAPQYAPENDDNIPF